jgi:hypothetical protein
MNVEMTGSVGPELKRSSRAMRPDPQQRPSGSEYADAIKGVLERAAVADQDFVTVPRKPLLTRPPVVAAVAVGFLAMLALNLFNFRRSPPQPPIQVQEATAQVSLLLAVHMIQTFQEEHGQLPGSLDDIGLSADEFTYSITGGGHFLVVAGRGEATFLYDSREGPENILGDIPLPGGTNR